NRGQVISTALPLALLTLGLALLKSILIASLFRATGSPLRDAARGGVVLMPTGEFAFVLLPLGTMAGLFNTEQAGLLSALAALTMLVASPLSILSERLLGRLRPADNERKEDFSDARGNVLIIGFGRFGQVIAQVLRTQGVEMTIID